MDDVEKLVWHKFSISFRHWLNMDGVEKVCLAQILHLFLVLDKYGWC